MSDDKPSIRKAKKTRYISLSKLFPNIVTIAALCCGLSAVRFAIIERWEVAVMFIVIAAVLDAADGALARLLKAQSRFGAELDSLSDIVSFGVAPALVMHIWILQNVPRYGWAVALFFVICCALRLARFNSMLQEEEESGVKKKSHFLGVPAPAGALLSLFPLAYTFEYEAIFPNSHIICMIYMVFISLLMISRIKTFSLKNIRFKQNIALPVMIAIVATIVFAIIEPWNTLMLIGLAYMGSIVFSFYRDNIQKSRKIAN